MITEFIQSIERHKLQKALVLLVCVSLSPFVSAEEQIIIEAKQISSVGENKYQLEENAVISQGDKQIAAEKITYNQNNGQVNAKGVVEFSDSQIKVDGSEGEFNIIADTGRVDNANYSLVGESGNGKAKLIQIKSKEEALLHDSTYSTCPVGDNDWRIVSSDLTLNTAEGSGKSVHTRLEFFDLPVFYFPYFKFPLDDRRKSGFLFPQIGYGSENGLDLRTPYYFNLAPNYDATLTPRILSKRGVGLESEFRYLLDSQAGEIHFDYLPYDDIYDDQRYLISFKQQGRISEAISNSFDLGYVSDKEYFSDLGRLGYVANTDHLNNAIDYNYRQGEWQAGLLVQAHQTIEDDVTKPYRRLPRFDLAYVETEGEWRNRFAYELTNFDHPDRETKVTGVRSDAYYKLQYQHSAPGWFIHPALSVRQSDYQLDDSYSESRTLYSVSFDSGIFLERDFNLFGKGMLQTLEPRIFYLYTPYRDQQNLPVFDSGATSLSYAQLFAENRFTGPDRVGDANQISVAVSSRFLDSDNGRTLLSMNFGEIFYLDDRRVTIGNDQLQTEENSNFIANIQLLPLADFRITGEVEWNHKRDYTESESLILEYRPDAENLFGITYLEQKNESAVVETDSATMRFAWEYDHNWKFVGKWNYSLLHDATQESFLGIEYDSGCWAARLVTHRFIEEMQNPADAKQQILLQVELLGVGGFGQDVDDFMEP